MSRVSRAGVLAAYRDGVTVICELAGQFADATWQAATPCSEWRAVDLACHLRCVADDYHEYLDDAPASRLARLLATNVPVDSLARKLARQNAAELAALPDAPGPEHIAAFADSARAYDAGWRRPGTCRTTATAAPRSRWARWRARPAPSGICTRGTAPVALEGNDRPADLNSCWPPAGGGMPQPWPR